MRQVLHGSFAAWGTPIIRTPMRSCSASVCWTRSHPTNGTRRAAKQRRSKTSLRTWSAGIGTAPIPAALQTGIRISQVRRVLAAEFDAVGLLAGRWTLYLRRTGLSTAFCKFCFPLPLRVTGTAAKRREGGAQRRKGEGATGQTQFHNLRNAVLSVSGWRLALLGAVTNLSSASSLAPHCCEGEFKLLSMSRLPFRDSASWAKRHHRACPRLGQSGTYRADSRRKCTRGGTKTSSRGYRGRSSGTPSSSEEKL